MTPEREKRIRDDLSRWTKDGPFYESVVSVAVDVQLLLAEIDALRQQVAEAQSEHRERMIAEGHAFTKLKFELEEREAEIGRLRRALRKAYPWLALHGTGKRPSWTCVYCLAVTDDVITGPHRDGCVWDENAKALAPATPAEPK